MVYQYQNDPPSTFVEYVPKSYSLNELRQFVGTYYSKELRAAYVIEVESGELIASHFRKDKVRLSPVSENQFTGTSYSFGQVQFIRDDNNDIQSFIVSSRNAKGIKFRKIYN